MPRRLAQQRMTSSELEWPLHAFHSISAVAELLLYTAYSAYSQNSNKVDFITRT